MYFILIFFFFLFRFKTGDAVLFKNSINIGSIRKKYLNCIKPFYCQDITQQDYIKNSLSHHIRDDF